MTYLLLRDNKQSGPYSLDDLKTKGLKAYDLVWVEGKSAAWRYPSEVAELSSFAPAVEEQPFDRFYKKPAAAAGSALSTQTAQAPSSGSIVTSQPFFSEEQSSPTRKRTIYVTMPGGTAAPVTVRETIREIPREPIRPVAAPLPIGDYAFSEPISAPSAGNRDHIGELMPQNTRRQKPNILQPVLIAVSVLILLAGGIFIGLSINKDTPGLQKLASQTAPTDNSQSTDHVDRTTAQQLPVPPVVTTVVTQPQTQNSSSAAPDHNRPNPATEGSAGKSSVVLSVVTMPKPRATLPGRQASQPLTTTDSSVTVAPVLRREAVHRTDPAENQDGGGKEMLKVNLASQVSVGANKYEVGTFGGISNLQVTVSNRSAYPLDVVVVEVQYIQANKKTYKTENLYFHGIGPGMTLMQEAPKSPRGIKIEYKITQINSKGVGLSEPGLSKSGL